MTKATLQAIVYAPIFILIIYLVFFNKEDKTIKVNPETKKTIKNTTLKTNNKNFMNNNINQISLEDFKKEMQKEDTILIDIRTPMEWDRYGIIPGTDKYIVFGGPNFETQISELDKTKKYLLYCFHGNRTDAARNYMEQLGFTRIKDLAGGINAWSRNGEKIGKKGE